MNNYGFDIHRDNELIAAGTHFWCGGHLCAVPIEQRSAKNPDCCVDCLKVIERDKRPAERDHWTGGKFIIGGKEFVVSSGELSCKDSKEVPLVRVLRGDAIGSNGSAVVSKLPDKGNPQAGVLKHAGGRPRKAGGDVSRVTVWRREKELASQGALL